MRAHFRQPGFNPSPEGTKIDGPPTPNQKIMLTRGVFGGLGYHWAALGQGPKLFGIRNTHVWPSGCIFTRIRVNTCAHYLFLSYP
jgi:hypothetical protein